MGNLYAGGYFTEIGGVAANRIAKWDDHTWSPLGGGVGVSAGSTTERVQTIANSGTNVFAGGTFRMAGGQESWHVARWSGSEWTGFGRVVSGVTALLTDEDYLYVASGFNFGNGPTGSTVYRWDGLAWYSLGAVDEFRGSVHAMVKMNGDLYVGGTVLSANGVDLGNIARWDGEDWIPLGTGTDDRVHALAVLGSDLYVGGWFVRAGGTGGQPHEPHCAVGRHQLEPTAHSDHDRFGQSRLFIGRDRSGSVRRGRVQRGGGTPAAGIARWNGTAWSPLGSGVGNLPQTLAASGNKLYVGGTFATAGGRPPPASRSPTFMESRRWKSCAAAGLCACFSATCHRRLLRPAPRFVERAGLLAIHRHAHG